jgi:hypothetical protein
MRSAPTWCVTKAKKPNPGLRRHLEAHLGFPRNHTASRVLGQAVLAERARLDGEGMRWPEPRKRLAQALLLPSPDGRGFRCCLGSIIVQLHHTGMAVSQGRQVHPEARAGSVEGIDSGCRILQVTI